MRKKLREKAGLTLVEMLAATAVLILLTLMLSTGLQMMMDTYQTMIAKSEVDLLLSTAVDALTDDLRYAWNVESRNSGVALKSGAQFEYADGEVKKDEFTYSSDSYGEKTHFWVVAGEDKSDYQEKYKDQVGQIAAKSTNKDQSGNPKPEETWLVLPTGAYGKGAVMTYKEYKVTKLTVTYKESDSGVITFTIELTVSDGKNSASTPNGGVTVRCLNPAKDTTTS